jgi:error-prone DNA polymerase
MSLSQTDADAIARAVKTHGPLRGVEALHRLSGVRVKALRHLALADAFSSMDLDRQSALWQVRALSDEALPIFDQAPQRSDQCASVPRLPAVASLRTVAHDYASVGLSLRAHPVSFMREELASRSAVQAIQLKDESRWPQGRTVVVAGLVLVRQRPSTANGIIFMTLEDETGVANLIVRPDVYQHCRRAVRHGVLVLARGRVERQGAVVHVLAHHIEDVTFSSDRIESQSRDFH